MVPESKLQTAQTFFDNHRSSGVLLHVSSLPSAYGIGDLGPVAHRWINCLADCGQQVWQILPLTPPTQGNSPYSSLSAMAGSPALISIEQMVVDGLLASDDGFISSSSMAAVQFSKVIASKNRAIETAWAAFTRKSGRQWNAYEEFCQAEKFWLDPFAMFMALREVYPDRQWTSWPKQLMRRDPSMLQTAAHDLADRIDRYRFEQFVFFSQLDRLRGYAKRRGVKLLGDVPIFVCHDSVDVWTHPHLFKLDRLGRPTVIAGVPPDYFSTTGQLWGNPLYNWKAMQADGFGWWISRFTSQLRHADMLRIDHFRGFAACWEVSAGAKTAKDGRWVRTPGHALFAAVKSHLGSLPFIAEDLGTITPDVIALRDDFAMPGMRVLQFGFGGDPASDHLPCNFIRRSVAYTGTHDNDTTRGWYATLNAAEKKFFRDYLGRPPRDVAWELLRTAWASVSNCAIAPMQDLLSLGSKARMNVPNRAVGNWGWRMSARDMSGDWRDQLAALTRTYGRLPRSTAV